MFIHIGNDHVIRTRDIIAIIDYNLISSSSIMQEMIENKYKENEVKGNASLAKSVIITNNDVYYSSKSVPTLEKRSSIISMLENIKDDKIYEDILESNHD